MKSFLGNFYSHLAIFSGHTVQQFTFSTNAASTYTSVLLICIVISLFSSVCLSVAFVYFLLTPIYLLPLCLYFCVPYYYLFVGKSVWPSLLLSFDYVCLCLLSSLIASYSLCVSVTLCIGHSLPLSLFVCLFPAFVCLSVSFYLHQPVSFYLCLSITFYLYLSVSFSLCLSVSFSLCLSFCLFVYLCPNGLLRFCPNTFVSLFQCDQMIRLYF